MDEFIVERTSTWFATVEINETLDPSVAAFLDELIDMLNARSPTKLDRAASTIRSAGHGWSEPERAVEVHLVHVEDDEADLAVAVGASGAIVSWLTTHEHIDPTDRGATRPWTSVVVDVVAAALSGEYEVQSHYRRDYLVKSRLIDVADPDHPRHLSTTGSFAAWLLWWGRRRVESRRLDYGVAPRATTGSASGSG